MTRIAVIADIHANLPALEAVLDDLAGRDLDEVLVGGDLVGRGPQGDAVARRIREIGLRSVLGNHEEYLLAFRRGEVPDDWLTHPDWAAARWMARELSEDTAAYLAELPFSLVAASASELRVVHGSPSSTREGVGPWTSDEKLGEIFDAVEEPVLVCAHTHRPLVKRPAAGGLVVNVGSVGLPFDGDPRARYAILERGHEGWRVEHVAVPYDRERTLDAYRSTGFLEAGHVTAELLALELRTAQSHLVPFVEWAAVTGRPASRDSLPLFLESFEPGTPLPAFLASVGDPRAR